jgi:hypothetical protein
MDVKNVKEHYGDFVVDALVDEEFDKTNPPYVVILTHYFRVSNDKIVSLIIIRNTPGGVFGRPVEFQHLATA